MKNKLTETSINIYGISCHSKSAPPLDFNFRQKVTGDLNAFFTNTRKTTFTHSLQIGIISMHIVSLHGTSTTVHAQLAFVSRRLVPR
jgi:hypothetical protein